MFTALEDAQLIAKENMRNLGRVSFERAARTDKGVHAAGQCVSLKMILPEDMKRDAIDKLNELLPESF